jgi:hypothetical protein
MKMCGEIMIPLQPPFNRPELKLWLMRVTLSAPE